MRKIFKIISIFFLISACHYGFSQDGGRVRLVVVNGQNVNFAFNSMEKYISGVTYTDYTIIGLTVVDTGAADLPGSWTLDFRALDPNLNLLIDGDAGNTLPFNTFRLTGSQFSGFGGGAWGVVTNTWDLDDIDQSIASDAVMTAAQQPDYTTDQIGITYECGTLTSLLGSTLDFYSVDILFTFTVTF